MQSDRKRIASEIRALAKEFSRIASCAPAGSPADVALAYHDVAERGGALLIEAYQAGLLVEVPGLAKLIDRGLEPARLFKQFHGYEVNVGVLLSGDSPDSQSRDTAMTCGLLPQLLPSHPVFRSKAYRGKNANKRALLTELRRAAEACKWLAEQTIAGGREPAVASKSRRGKKTVVKVLADCAKTRRSGKKQQIGPGNPHGLGSDVKCRSR
jgi:hypothetical protein